MVLHLTRSHRARSVDSVDPKARSYHPPLRDPNAPTPETQPFPSVLDLPASAVDFKSQEPISVAPPTAQSTNASSIGAFTWAEMANKLNERLEASGSVDYDALFAEIDHDCVQELEVGEGNPLTAENLARLQAAYASEKALEKQKQKQAKGGRKTVALCGPPRTLSLRSVPGTREGEERETCSRPSTGS